MEFPVEVSPFLIVNHTDDFEEVDFAPASAPLILNNALLPLNNECKLNESQLIHEMYYLNFPENDFTNETYFKMLKSLMTISQIKKNAVLAKHKLSSPPLQRIFASYPGTGKAFVVVSHFQGHSSVYVPSFTYGCYGFDECSTLCE